MAPERRNHFRRLSSEDLSMVLEIPEPFMLEEIYFPRPPENILAIMRTRPNFIATAPLPVAPRAVRFTIHGERIPIPEDPEPLNLNVNVPNTSASMTPRNARRSINVDRLRLTRRHQVRRLQNSIPFYRARHSMPWRQTNCRQTIFDEFKVAKQPESRPAETPHLEPKRPSTARRALRFSIRVISNVLKLVGFGGCIPSFLR